ncbi:AraC family transcriptional regulator [uncultured Secundilactobacillus sp.]|uniref:AraC family transcriptional regulator n=1 Tax=uncultured Secundilactobacillus sp. TaxID=2813935 RepID=UPI00258C697D|nr:AraC family transcriptional regulator [uncultured Secundilactobacillus sp.]
MKKYTPLPLIDTSIYLFGGHQRTVAGGWQFFEQKHQAFELMYILAGSQTTEIKNISVDSYGPGSAMIISPGTIHTNRNSSRTEPMTYICTHFNIESVDLKSDIISKVANTVLEPESDIAKLIGDVCTKMVGLVASQRFDANQTKIQIEITYLQFLSDLLMVLKKMELHENAKYSEQEAKMGRDMANLIKEMTEAEVIPNFSFGDVCQELGISTGYGHRTFKKVYGITPLHYIEEEKYQKAKVLLGAPSLSVEEVAFRMGSSSTSNFSKQFRKWSGVTPSNYQHQILKKREVRTLKESGYFE